MAWHAAAAALQGLGRSSDALLLLLWLRAYSANRCSRCSVAAASAAPSVTVCVDIWVASQGKLCFCGSLAALDLG